MTLKKHLLIVAALFFACQLSAQCDRLQDSLSLIALYNATDGANWINTWDLNQPLSTWYGVTLNADGCVLCIDFDQNVDCKVDNDAQIGNNLSGSLPIELGQLSNIQIISLPNNQLVGAIPYELGNLSQLRELNFNNNILAGNIPLELANLSNLTVLNLGNNVLSGAIPNVLEFLRNLQVLELGQNLLSGPIPPELGNLNNLNVFKLENNQLSGCFPLRLFPKCSLGFYNNAIKQGYNLTGNPSLPWSGDFERFCNGEQQEGASCDDGNPNTQNDVIQADCRCGGATVSTTDIANHEQLKVSPNPSDGLVYLQGTKVFEVSAFNLIGAAIPIHFSEEEQSIHFSKPQSGVYLLQLQTEHGKQVRKVIIE